MNFTEANFTSTLKIHFKIKLYLTLFNSHFLVMPFKINLKKFK